MGLALSEGEQSSGAVFIGGDLGVDGVQLVLLPLPSVDDVLLYIGGALGVEGVQVVLPPLPCTGEDGGDGT
jgi:hypothetical protein